MEPLQKQLAELPKKLAAMPRGLKIGLGLTTVLVVGAAMAVSALSSAGEYQYAFTNLSPEDSAEIGARLKTASIPHRFEAGGSALSVPASRVYDVRLLLSADGLPRSGGTGFELFDKGDFGVSEFTQKVNLRRATEGELARTLGKLAGVRSARVHLVLPEKGVFRGEERQASAAVVLNLHPGRRLDERELLGVRHLVASAVPSLAPAEVTIVDSRGSVLSAEESWGDQAAGFQKRLEKDLEQRVVSLLEPAVGAGQVVARVTAEVDASEVQSTADAFDPDGQVLKSERVSTNTQNEQSQKRTASGVVGAAANQPLGPNAQQPGQTQTKNVNQNEETRNYEISRTTTRTVQRAPRLSRLSVAVLVDGVDGKPREAADVQRLGELVRRAVGFDEARGDKLEISSAVFSHSADEVPAAAAEKPTLPVWAYAAIGGGALLAIAAALFFVLRSRKPKQAELVLRPGARVSELESTAREVAAVTGGDAKPADLPAAEAPRALPDPVTLVREKARELVKSDPARAAHILRAWIQVENQQSR